MKLVRKIRAIFQKAWLDEAETKEKLCERAVKMKIIKEVYWKWKD